MPCSANEVFPCLCSQWHLWQRNNDSLRWSGLLHHEGNARWNLSVQQIFFDLSKFQPDSVAVWGNPPKKQTPAGPRSKGLHPKIFLENPHDFAQAQPWALTNIFEHTAENPDRYLFENPRPEIILGFPFFSSFSSKQLFPGIFGLFRFLKNGPMVFFLGRDTYREMAPHTFDTNIY